MIILIGLYGVLYGLWGLMLSFLEKKSGIETFSKNLFYILLSSLFTYLCLAHAIYSNNFILKYAYEQSALNLQFPISLGLLWSGQVGANWLFWIILCLWSWVFMRYAPFTRAPTKTEKAVLVFYLVGFVSIILNTSSPFEMLLPFSPSTGLELNPLLQHYAISFHPPLLISSTASTFALVLLDLLPLSDKIKKDIFAILIRLILGGLGLAILAGSFWAYHVLGWGGWWFWDPIETISLTHWLGLLWILHRENKDNKDSFIIWAIIALNLWIVRSDQLISVHSFISQGWSILWLLYAIGCFFIALRFHINSNFFAFPTFLMTLILCLFGLWSPFIYKIFHISLQMSASYYEQIFIVVFISLFLYRSKIPYASEHSLFWLCLCALNNTEKYQILFICYICLVKLFSNKNISIKEFQHMSVFAFILMCFAQRLLSFQTEWVLNQPYKDPTIEITLQEHLKKEKDSHMHDIYILSVNQKDLIEVEQIYYPYSGQTLSPIRYWRDMYGNDYGFCYAAEDGAMRIFYRPFMQWIWLFAFSIVFVFFLDGSYLIYKKTKFFRKKSLK